MTYRIKDTLLIIINILLLAACGSAPQHSKSNDPSPKQAAPHFIAPLLGGGTFYSDKVLGHGPVLINFWASWCPACLDEAPFLIELFSRYRDRGLTMVSVNIDETDSRDEAIATAKKLGLPTQVVLDPEKQIFNQYTVKSAVPLTVIVNKDGHVTYRHVDFQLADKKQIEAQVKAVLPQSN